MRTRFFSGLPREVAVLTAVAFAVAVGFGVVAPAIPQFARDFGVGRTAAGAVISAFAFMRLVSALASGRLVNRVGERVVLATGIGIVAVSSALAGLAQNYTQLLLLRGIGGIGSAMFTVSAVSLLLRVVDADQRGRATSRWQTGFLLGAIAGPAIGGPLTDISLRAPFFVYAGTLAVAGGIGMLFLTRTDLHERDEAAKGSPTDATTLGQALRRPDLRRRWLRERIWRRLPARPAIRFAQVYVLMGGALDGRAGFRRAVFEAWQEMCTDLKAEALAAGREP